MREIIFHFSEEQLQSFLKKTYSIFCQPPLTIFLHGSLGSGKTTFVRSFLLNAGIKGHIKSPSYSLVEEYKVNNLFFYHFDLYRLKSPDELEEIGLRDYVQPNAVLLFEWPEKGENFLPKADLDCYIEPTLELEKRKFRWCSKTSTGDNILNRLRELHL